MEDYKKKYEEALERAKVVNPGTTDYNIVTEIFPELKESEEERIRKELIEFVKSHGKFKQEYISWLEKQGEKKLLNNDKYQTVPVKILDRLYESEKELKRLKQGEKTLTDEIKPKFKVGDWIVQENIGVYKIIEICKSWYEVIDVEDNHYSISFDKEYMCRLWTIQDAKDGDVLYTSSTASNEVFIFKGLTIEGYIECYCSYDSEDKYCEGKYHFIGRPSFMTHPATKEKRELLFQMIVKKGYIWDPEKKELNKIKQNGNNYTIVEKEKKLTYKDVINNLFTIEKELYYIDTYGSPTIGIFGGCTFDDGNIFKSKRQAEKLLAINKLMNVAKYLNGDWQPDWNNVERKYCIFYSNQHKTLEIDSYCSVQYGVIYFKYRELAQQAIEILGEETIKLALCSDY